MVGRLGRDADSIRTPGILNRYHKLREDELGSCAQVLIMQLIGTAAALSTRTSSQTSREELSFHINLEFKYRAHLRHGSSGLSRLFGPGGESTHKF